MAAIISIVVFCFTSIYAIDYLITHFPTLHFGKDNGMVMMIVLTCMAAMVLFFFIERSVLKYFLGFIVGVISNVTVYLLILIFNQANTVALPLIADNSIAFILIAMFAISRYKKNNPSLK